MPQPPVNLGVLFEMERRVRGLESAPASPPPCSQAPAQSQEDDGEQEENWRSASSTATAARWRPRSSPPSRRSFR